MALQDKFRLNELVKKGSKAIPREKSGGLVVRKKDDKQFPSHLKEKEAKKFVDLKRKKLPVPPSIIQKPKKQVPFGFKPIKGKQISAKYKSDLVDTDEFEKVNEEQESFGGETAGYLEKPSYNEEELKKAVDVKVDELIKKKKVEKGPYVLKKVYDDLLEVNKDLVDQVEDLRKQLEEANSEIAALIGEVESLRVQLDSAELQRAAAENETQVANERYAKLLEDFQQALIKGTKEGIERVSLTAQVRGLQAQKATLIEQVKLADRIEQQEEESQANIADATAAAEGATQSGEAAYKVTSRTTEEYDFRFQSLRKSSGWTKNGNKLELLNLDNEKEVSYQITVKAKGGGHGSPWIGFNPSSGTIPKRSGTNPGVVGGITASKIRNVRSPKGRKKTFEDEVTIKIGSKTFTGKALFYRKLRKKGKSN